MKKVLLALALSAGVLLSLPLPAGASHYYCGGRYGYSNFNRSYCYPPPIVYYRPYNSYGYPRYYVTRPSCYRHYSYGPRPRYRFNLSVYR